MILNEDNLLLTGDFNLPNVFSQSSNHSKDKRDEKFYEFLAKNHPLTQCVNSPTKRENILDFVFIRKLDNFSDIKYFPPIGHSDHDLLSGNFQLLV